MTWLSCALILIFGVPSCVASPSELAFVPSAVFRLLKDFSLQPANDPAELLNFGARCSVFYGDVN